MIICSKCKKNDDIEKTPLKKGVYECERCGSIIGSKSTAFNIENKSKKNYLICGTKIYSKK